jgi:hypothetical protein
MKCMRTKYAHEMAQLKHELAAIKTEIDSLCERVSPRQPSAEEIQTLESLRVQLTAQTIKTNALVTERDSLKIEVINLKALLREREPPSPVLDASPWRFSPAPAVPAHLSPLTPRSICSRPRLVSRLRVVLFSRDRHFT